MPVKYNKTRFLASARHILHDKTVSTILLEGLIDSCFHITDSLNSYRNERCIDTVLGYVYK